MKCTQMLQLLDGADLDDGCTGMLWVSLAAQTGDELLAFLKLTAGGVCQKKPSFPYGHVGRLKTTALSSTSNQSWLRGPHIVVGLWRSQGPIVGLCLGLQIFNLCTVHVLHLA